MWNTYSCSTISLSLACFWERLQGEERPDWTGGKAMAWGHDSFYEGMEKGGAWRRKQQAGVHY